MLTTARMFDKSASLVSDYYNYIHKRKQVLFALYEKEQLERKIVPQSNDWTWAYRLVVNGQIATGSSIGEDEIKFFFDLPHLIDAKYSYCIGVAFGLSMFNLALAKPDNRVYGIDNYSERAGAGTNHARELVERLIHDHFVNVCLHIGTSPEDTPVCLSTMPQDAKLSLVFIDGLHSNSAAMADYTGVRSFIDDRTVVLWHDAFLVSNAFRECFEPNLFNRLYIMRTYGVMGIYFNTHAHPALEHYLRDNCLVRDNWEQKLAPRVSGIIVKW